MLLNNILYAIKLLTEKKIRFGKTFIQKVLYLALPKVERDLYYIPYYYGPYSENIQLLLRSLEFSNYITYNYKSQNYSLQRDIDVKQEDTTKQRIKGVIDFLVNNHIKSTNKISNLAKVFMILDANDSLNNGHKVENLIELIKKRANFVGWIELSKLDKENIEDLIKLSKNLAKTLPN